MVVCCPKLQHEIWRNLDWHSQYQNELNFYQDYRILVFLNLHLFFSYVYYRLISSLIWVYPPPPPSHPKKILNPYCFLSHFVKEILKDWKWKFCTRYIEFQSGCIFWHPYMQRKIKLLTSIKAFITAVAEGHTSPKPPCTGIQAVIDINGLVWFE